MNVIVDILNDSDLQAYGGFIDRHPGGLFFHSLKYRAFLTRILGSSRAFYIVAKEAERIVGVLPAFIQDLEDGRTIINSLPFYGSHGGILVDESASDKEGVSVALMNHLMQSANEERAISLTLVDNPFATENDFYARYLKMEPTDKRIGQVTDLRIPSNASIADALMLKFHSKTRNMVRKAEKAQFSIEKNTDAAAFDVLYDIHARNMQAIGGRAKPRAVFKAIEEVFEPKQDYEIYFAKRDGRAAAGMLLFYYKQYCEYYTPVIEPEFRSDQPLSLLIFQGMQDALARGCSQWNWGGTWLNQDGVYLFKKRWGADHRPYGYYSCVFDRDYIALNGPRIIDNSFFYVYPKPKAEERPAA